MLDKNVSIVTLQMLINSNLVEGARNVIWNCSNGINSIYTTNISGMNSVFDIFQYNYSTSGTTTFVCNISSRDGNDSISLTFNILSLQLENYDIIYTNISRRIIGFNAINYFNAVSFNMSINTNNVTTNKSLNLSSNTQLFVFVESNYSTEDLSSLAINLSSNQLLDTYTEYFSFNGVSIENYARLDTNYTNKVLSFELVNTWYPGNVSWTINNPSINGSRYLNTNERMFVFVENNYSVQQDVRLNISANISKFSDSYADLFSVRPLELLRFDAIAPNTFELFAINHLNRTQSISWSIDNVTSLNVSNITNNLFVIVQTNYSSGISIPVARINSTSYNDSQQEVIVI
jgi:hypothetical protein